MPKSLPRLAALAAWAALVLPAAFAGENRAATTDGFAVPAGKFGALKLEYPQIIDDASNVAVKRTGLDLRGASAEVAYEGGAAILVEAAPNNTIRYTVRNLKNGSKLRIGCLLPFTLADGGAWRADNGAFTDFPLLKPAKPHLYQGHAQQFTVRMAAGDQVTFTSPQYAYTQLQDNREWNWTIFAWSVMITHNADNPVFTIGLAPGRAVGVDPQAAVIVDRFGQDRKMDFPGKLKSVEELRADIAADEAYYARFERPAFDRWGGLPVGKAMGLEATGFFRVAKVSHDGSPERWMFVDPDGNPFWQQGICGFFPGDDYTYTVGRKEIFEWLPEVDDAEFATAWNPNGWWRDKAFSFYLANVIRKYGKPYDRGEWAARMIDRVKRFGFNSNGAFSGVAAAHREQSFGTCPTLPLGTWTLGQDHMIKGVRGFFDPFNPATVNRIDELFAAELPKSADDPLIIGWFLENEQGAEDVARVIPSLGAASHAKRRLVTLLRQTYGDDVAAFNTAWKTDAATFDALTDRGLVIATPAAAADMKRFTELFFDEYYRVIRTTYDKYDKNHLLIGNRWQPGTANNEALIRAAAKYMDVMSLNYYTYGFDRAYLARLTGWAGDKPWLFSEWHYCSPSDSGLPTGLDVGSQDNRAKAYKHYVEQAAAMPYVIGQQWFIQVDQARAGRFFEEHNGEKSNCGLFSVADRPWKALLEAAGDTNRAIYDIAFGKQAPYQWDDARFADKGVAKREMKAGRATRAIPMDGTRDAWPGVPPEMIGARQLVLGPDHGEVTAAFRMAWDDDVLHLMVDVVDPTPLQNGQKAADLWNGDGVEIFFGGDDLAEPGELRFGDRQVLLGAREDAPAYLRNGPTLDHGMKTAVFPKVDGSGYVLQAQIPWKDLGIAKPEAGQLFLFDLAVDDGEDGEMRKRQFMWNGGAKASNERSLWGRLRLTD